MFPSNDRKADDGGRYPPSQAPEQAARHPPLVIVSEQGRHSQASRRLVRAQAARASAAQSRVTRARNREEREGTTREGQQSPGDSGATQTLNEPSEPNTSPPSDSSKLLPLASWLINTLGISANEFAQGAASLASAVPSTAATATSTLGQATNFGSWATSAMFGSLQTSGSVSRQLPMALPRGFAALQQRLPISDVMLHLLTRTACIDFASPGAERRLHALLFDLIVFSGVPTLSIGTSHPIQHHLRIACTCLTIFQGQRANGQHFAHDRKYQIGLDAAWSEATMLDKEPLSEPKSAQASLWAVFIISVTTGATANYFRQQLESLLIVLGLKTWHEVRRTLLDFIFPVSFLDEPCESFYKHLREIPMGFN